VLPALGAGGAERVSITLLKYLDRSKFRLTLVVIDSKVDALLDEVPKDVELISLQYLRVRHALPALFRLVWRRRPELVFSNLGYLNLAFSMIRPFLPSGVKVIGRESSIVSEVQKQRAFAKLWHWAYSHFYQNLDGIVCQSRFMAEDLLCNFSVPKNKIKVINNPIDIERINVLANATLGQEYPNDEIIRFVAVGRLVNVKGFALLFEALAKLPIDSWELALVGAGPLEGVLRNQAELLHLSNNIKFVGYKKNPYPFMKYADAYILSSYYEGFPNVVLESLTCGTPVIATPAVGGTAEILNGVEGCFIATEVGACSLADAIASWLNSPRKRVSEIEVARYDVNSITKNYEEYFLSVLSGQDTIQAF
jgi:glycosyltransferase involved in cell wall biosynthesis